VTFGEWVLDNLKWSIEYQANWDYSAGQGGTGKFSTGVFTNLTYNF
jgi:ABC-type molybdenum transport system ATPase subunit/photorepair protein PhrA